MIVVSLLSSFLVVGEWNPVGHLLISVTKNMTQKTWQFFEMGHVNGKIEKAVENLPTFFLLS